jgi:predicted regulator of Ras-like GTPase activity (Roadblock/LC7/MglB family)
MANKSISDASERDQILLSEEQYHQISQELDTLQSKINSQLVLLGDMTGQLISKKGNIAGVDMSILTALISSDFSATSEIARILGKNNQFRLHFHEGNNRNLYISSVKDQLFLAVVFHSSITLGMVRIFSKKTIDKIERIIESGYQESLKYSDIIDSEFKSFVTEGLDKILG